MNKYGKANEYGILQLVSILTVLVKSINAVTSVARFQKRKHYAPFFFFKSTVKRTGLYKLHNYRERICKQNELKLIKSEIESNLELVNLNQIENLHRYPGLFGNI